MVDHMKDTYLAVFGADVSEYGWSEEEEECESSEEEEEDKEQLSKIGVQKREA